MQIYRYKPGVMRKRYLFFVAVVVVFVIPLTAILKDSPESADQWWESFILLWMWSAVGLVFLHHFYLWRIACTAVLTLDSGSIGYHDCYIKATIAWRDVTELTPTVVRSAKGRSIFFKLGIYAVDNWEELAANVVDHAGLSLGQVGKDADRLWIKLPQPMERVA